MRNAGRPCPFKGRDRLLDQTPKFRWRLPLISPLDAGALSLHTDPQTKSARSTPDPAHMLEVSQQIPASRTINSPAERRPAFRFRSVPHPSHIPALSHRPAAGSCRSAARSAIVIAAAPDFISRRAAAGRSFHPPRRRTTAHASNFSAAPSWDHIDMPVQQQERPPPRASQNTDHIRPGTPSIAAFCGSTKAGCFRSSSTDGSNGISTDHSVLGTNAFCHK